MSVLTNRKEFFAYFVLAMLFFKHIFKKLFVESNGIKQFKENYNSEFLMELTPTQYEKQPIFESCINCSLCDMYCTILGNFQRDGIPKVSSLILSNSRAMEEFRFSYKEIDIFSQCQDCTKCESVCPNEYPIFDLIQFMSDQNNSIEEYFNDK